MAAVAVADNAAGGAQIRPSTQSLAACKGKITELFARWMSSSQGELVIQTLIRETIAASSTGKGAAGSGRNSPSLGPDHPHHHGDGASPPATALDGGHRHETMMDAGVSMAERRAGTSSTPHLGAKFFAGVDEVEMMRAHSPGASSPVSPNAAAALRAVGAGGAGGSGSGLAGGGGGGVKEIDPSLPRAVHSSPELSRSPQPQSGSGGAGQRFIDPIPMSLDGSFGGSVNGNSNKGGSGSGHNSPSNQRTREFLQQQASLQGSGIGGAGGGGSGLNGSSSASNLARAASQQLQQQQHYATYDEIPRFFFPKGQMDPNGGGNSPFASFGMMGSGASGASSNSGDTAVVLSAAGQGGGAASLDANEAYRKLTTFFAPPGSRATATSLDVAHRGLKRANIGQMCSEVFGVPAWMRGVVFRKMLAVSQLPDNGPSTVIRLAEAKRLLELLQSLSPTRRLFEIIRGSGADTGATGMRAKAQQQAQQHISFDDLVGLVRSVVDFHPGLEFLTQEEFQNAYCRTVAFRILFKHDPHGLRHVTWAEFCSNNRSRLPEVLQTLDGVADINQVLEYFSYEHFYVLYCRFWELDTDKDLHISLDDLKEYNGGTLCTRVLERVVAGKGRRATSQRPGFMNFEDFVYFCLAEEDKTSDAAKRYWFNVLDIDGDGMISGFELNFFFEEQKGRLIESMGPDQPLKEADLFCQTLDMVTPALPRKEGIRLEDLRRCDGPADVFLNLFINAFKFLNFENRDPFEEFRSKQAGERTPWDRFARAEYDRLAAEAMQQQ